MEELEKLKQRAQYFFDKFYELVDKHISSKHYPCCCSTLSCAIEGLDKYTNKIIFDELKKCETEFNIAIKSIHIIDDDWFPND